MTVGTGIFLGLIVLATVYLYVQTRHSQALRTASKWYRVGTAALLVVGLLSVSLWAFQEYQESKPSTPERYADIALKDSMDDVLSAKGYPAFVLFDDPSDPFSKSFVATDELPSDKKITDYVYWSYDAGPSGRIDVDFSQDSRSVVRIFCYGPEFDSCPELLGFSGGESEEDVIRRLGKPERIESTQGTGRIFSYPQWDAALFLKKRRVHGLQVGRKTESERGTSSSETFEPRDYRTLEEMCADSASKDCKHPIEPGPIDRLQ